MWTATKKLADGTVNYYAYAYKGGALIAKANGRNKDEAREHLEQILSLPEYISKFAAAKEVQEIRPAPSVNYIDGLINSFLRSPEFSNLKPGTQRDYRNYLEAFRSEFGDWRTALFEDPRIAQDMSEWRDSASGARTGDLRMAVVSRLFSWARGRGMTSANPTDAIERIHKADRSEIIWDDDSLSRLLAECSEPLARAVNLALLTGLRQGDLIRLPWSAVSDISISYRTSKRGKPVIIPLTPALKDLLETTPRVSPIVLTSNTGNPWTGDGLRTAFYRAKEKAKIENLRWHDFRGTAVTRLAKTDLRLRDIARIVGWSEARVEAIMARYVSSDAIAADMLARMVGERKTQTAHKPDP